MDVCFSCHGVKHGQQPALASGNCNTCHPKGFKKVPSNHTLAWKKTDHKRESGSALRNCQICHSVAFCDKCHQKKNVKINLAQTYFFSQAVAQSLLKTNRKLPVLLPIQINTAQPITIWQCRFCHEMPGDYRSKKLKFRHVVHVRISCNQCHREFPHQPSGSKRPTMDICFSCHAMIHGPQAALAGSRCDLCHPKDFPKVPSNHGRWFRQTGHRLVQGKALRNCQMCHTRTFCEECHRKKGVAARPVEEYFFESTILSLPRLGYIFNITAEQSMSNCGICHGNIDAFKNPNLIFKHDLHLKRGFSCDRCHVVFPHYTRSNISDEAKQAMADDLIRWKVGRSGITAKPSMRVCYGCHALIHSNQGLVATGKCNACHPRSFNLVPSNHGRWFRQTGHKNAAEVDLSGCEMCHPASFCERCHSVRKVKPQDHQIRDQWRVRHGRVFAKKENCVICHKQSYCDDCHKTKIPHEVTWLAKHFKVARTSPVARAQCNMCHSQKRSCQDCHHGYPTRQKLTRENCVRCHAILRKNFREIYQIGRLLPKGSPGRRTYRSFSVHQAHFEMTNTPPFTCDKCHDKVIKHGAENYPFKPLCGRCHGAYKRGKLIAKFRADGELCLRCHTNLPWAPRR
jgi:hypothetical protein